MQAVNGTRLRGRQPEWFAAIRADLETRSRILVIAPGGVGKTTVFAALAADYWSRGIRTLVLENRDRLTEQTAERIRNETGLEVDIEKGEQRASPHAAIVVMCVPSGSKIPRLTGFSESHFGVVVVDECHLALAPSWLRIIYYFHYGAISLGEKWVRPEDGTYTPLAKVIGFTASPDLGSRKNLGDLFQGPKPSVNYSYLTAIEEGWLVGIEEINVPVRVDTRRFKVKRSVEGDSFGVAEQNEAYTPEVIEKLAQQVITYGADRKGIAFAPSVEIARQAAEAINRLGVKAIFVSGECIDKNEKTDDFAASGPGTWLINCSLYCYGVDFVDCDAIFPMGAIISKAKYVQIVYRGTRVLPGVVSDDMTAAERVAAIAASAKKKLRLISPHFISLRIHICEPYDLFGGKPEGAKGPKEKPDLNKPAEIRDYQKALERELNKHANRQPRTIDPVKLCISLGMPEVMPDSAQGAASPSVDELDYLLSKKVSTVDLKNSAQAQALISQVRLREQVGLATPERLEQLILELKYPKEKAVTISDAQARVFLWKRIRYKPPEQRVTHDSCYCNAIEHPPCSFCESGAASIRDGT